MKIRITDKQNQMLQALIAKEKKILVKKKTTVNKKPRTN
jgi:hypothetical protein